MTGQWTRMTLAGPTPVIDIGPNCIVGPWPAFVLAVRMAFTEAAIEIAQKSALDLVDMHPVLKIIAGQWRVREVRALMGAIFDGIPQRYDAGIAAFFGKFS